MHGCCCWELYEGGDENDSGGRDENIFFLKKMTYHVASYMSWSDIFHVICHFKTDVVSSDLQHCPQRQRYHFLIRRFYTWRYISFLYWCVIKVKVLFNQDNLKKQGKMNIYISFMRLVLAEDPLGLGQQKALQFGSMPCSLIINWLFMHPSTSYKWILSNLPRETTDLWIWLQMEGLPSLFNSHPANSGLRITTETGFNSSLKPWLKGNGGGSKTAIYPDVMKISR